MTWGKPPWGGSSGVSQFAAYVRLAGAQNAVNKELVYRQHEIVTGENPDRLVYNNKTIYLLLWGVNQSDRNTLICPLPYMHPVKNHTHVAFNGNIGPTLNRLTYALADFGQTMAARISARWLQTPGISNRQISTVLSAQKVIYTISPTLFPRPSDWPANRQVLGFRAPERVTAWLPDQALVDFLENNQHRRILLITFGSMINPEPAEKTTMILEILERNQIPAIVNTAAGGLVEPADYDRRQFHFVNYIPYDWIFPQIYV